MRPVEKQFLEQIRLAMRIQDVSQQDFATHKGITRQAVGPYLTGKRGLLTETGKDLLEFLGLRIRLEPIEEGKIDLNTLRTVVALTRRLTKRQVSLEDVLEAIEGGKNA